MKSVSSRFFSWMAEKKRDLDAYAYAADVKKVDEVGALDLLRLEYLIDHGACVLGTPEQSSPLAIAMRRPVSTCCCAS